MASNWLLNTDRDTITRMTTLVRIATTETKFALGKLEEQALDEDQLFEVHQALEQFERVATDALRVAQEGLQRFPRRR